ncbi:MAG: hypothetical protein KKB51_24775 [Candidatus Riflebacteria bacterium]|nr:hypothetical protein [Candidatus Riflebacteria bacterium]
MKATNYIEGILLFTAIVLYLVPIQSLATMQNVPVSILVCLGSYGLLLIARRPRSTTNAGVQARKTAWHLAVTGVILGSIFSYIGAHDQAGFIALTGAYMLCIFYGIALSVLVFSFINRPPVRKNSEDSHLLKQRFNTLDEYLANPGNCVAGRQ